jgi:hypothetical protein
MTVDITELSRDEREFVTGIINRLDSGDVKNVGTELLAEFKRALTPEVFQKGGVSTLLCKRPGLVFGMGARGKGQHPFPRPAV